MSYLNALRLHFAGRFQANVSTVNNDPAHFDNATFKSSYQEMQGPGMQPPNGWFNPQGDAAWRLLGCRVTSAWTPAGAVAAGDPVLRAIVADSDSQVPAKLVDLDSEQQLVSEIWGLQVRLAATDGTTLMTGDFEPAAFIDIWDRSTASSGGDTIAGAMYQSVLTNLQWADVSASAFLTALKQAASDGVLSIKFNVDSFNLDYTSADFMTGRVVGTIGPASRGEPQHLLIGRQFMAEAAVGGNFFKPVGGINFFAGVVDAAARCVYLDLGNALTTGTDGALNDQGDLTFGIYDPLQALANPADRVIRLGTIPSKGRGGYASDPLWYPRTAGVVVLPIGAEWLSRVQSSPLAVSGAGNVFISEWTSGVFVRADRFVYRLSPGDRVEIPVYAMQWGQPLAGADLSFPLDPSQLQAQEGTGFPYVAPSPPAATPTTALAFDASARTGSDGRAVLSLSATDPGTPRWFDNGADYGIDGQVYGIRPGFSNAAAYNGPVNQWNFVSLLLWSGFMPSTPLTWTDVQPIFQQYANLYPVMNRFLNLADYDEVVANSGLLLLSFGLDAADPNTMPVTRDLSPAKRQAILTWLQNPLPGAVPAPKAAAPAAAVAATAVGEPVALRGGKAAAAARRLVLQSRYRHA